MPKAPTQRPSAIVAVASCSSARIAELGSLNPSPDAPPWAIRMNPPCRNSSILSLDSDMMMKILNQTTDHMEETKRHDRHPFKLDFHNIWGMAWALCQAICEFLFSSNLSFYLNHNQLHQILPPILSILLNPSLPPSHATSLRTPAAQTLSKLLTQHSTNPSLSPRIMMTLLLTLISPGKSHSTREGAIHGLIGWAKRL